MEQVQQDEKTDIRTLVKSFIIDNYLFGVVPEDFGDDDSLLQREIINSTGILELIEFLSDTFEIRIEDEEILPENLDSIDSICNFIKRKTDNNSNLS